MDGRERLLEPGAVARLGRMRLALRRRVDGRFTGVHAARGYGSSLDFADYREYTPGDDPRMLDPYASARSGRRLVRLFEAEDTAALRIVVDGSGSMGVGGKRVAAARAAAALASVAVAGGDRVRVVLAGEVPDAGPWFAGPAAAPAIERRLQDATATPGSADVAAALRRAHGEGPRGPVVLVSDLLVDEWAELVRLLGGGRADGVLVHVLGREDLEPTVRGDVRVADVESGAEVPVAVTDEALAAYTATRDAWLDAVDRECGARGVAVLRVMDDEPLDALLAAALSHGVMGRR